MLNNPETTPSEGIPCGCVVVGTNLGGLPEAIGPCGVTVPNADTSAMARALRSLLADLHAGRATA
jgi:glycosyltransferase involved in cell wall biosynthesis